MLMMTVMMEWTMEVTIDDETIVPSLGVYMGLFLSPRRTCSFGWALVYEVNVIQFLVNVLGTVPVL